MDHQLIIFLSTVIGTWVAATWKISQAINGVESRLNARIDSVEQRLGNRIDSLACDVKKIDRRLAHIEGAYFGKDLPKHIAIGDE